VTGDSVVAELSLNGEWLHDVMIYNRSGFKSHLHILECCYYSYVGALYRKNIHDRVGYYDPSFRGAGDTEFKNRALPFIQIKYLPETLGIFLNYPDGRTTAHPRAELEDLRAWYLFRTVGGLKYITQNMTRKQKEDLLHDACGYRKSFCGHLSHDLDVAKNLALILLQEIDDPKLRKFFNLIESAHSATCAIEKCTGPFDGTLALLKSNTALKELSVGAAEYFGSSPKTLNWFHDNRFEQHSSTW